MRYQPPHQSSLVLALSVIIYLRSLKTEDCSIDALQRDVLRRVARPDQQQSLPRELVFVSEVVSVQDPAGEPLDTREVWDVRHREVT